MSFAIIEKVPETQAAREMAARGSYHFSENQHTLAFWGTSEEKGETGPAAKRVPSAARVWPLGCWPDLKTACQPRCALEAAVSQLLFEPSHAMQLPPIHARISLLLIRADRW